MSSTESLESIVATATRSAARAFDVPASALTFDTRKTINQVQGGVAVASRARHRPRADRGARDAAVRIAAPARRLPWNGCSNAMPST